MITVERGQFFLDYHSIKVGKEKAKFFLALTSGDELDEEVICFVINTEKRMDLYNVCCNKSKQKFILYNEIHNFNFLEKPSSIMLDEARKYYVKEFFDDGIKLLDDIAEEKICREIKNCIDPGYILPKFWAIIQADYKIKR